MEETDQEGNTPLLIATELGNLAIVRLLLEKGASANVCTKDRLTPLLIAAQQGNSELCKELLDHGSYLDDEAEAAVRKLQPLLIKGTTSILDCCQHHLLVCCKHHTSSLTLIMASMIIISIVIFIDIMIPYVRRAPLLGAEKQV